MNFFVLFQDRDDSIHPKVLHVVRGCDAVFTCKHYERRMWLLMRNLHPVTLMRESQETLRIEKVQPVDTGYYVCYGWHNEHRYISVARLTILGK